MVRTPCCDSSPTSSAALTLFHGKALAGNGTNVILQALAILQQRGVDVRVIMLPSASAGGEPYDPHFLMWHGFPQVERPGDAKSRDHLGEMWVIGLAARGC